MLFRWFIKCGFGNAKKRLVRAEKSAGVEKRRLWIRESCGVCWNKRSYVGGIGGKVGRLKLDRSLIYCI